MIDDEKKPSSDSSQQAANLDDLDSVLNFEAKEFSDLVATMGRVLSVNGAGPNGNK